MFKLSSIICHFVALGSLATKRWICASASSSVRVGPQEGSITWEVDHIKIHKPGQRPMPNVLELASQDMTGLHRQIGMFALQGLNPSQFIHADGALSLLGSLRGTCIHLTPATNLLVAPRIGHLGQPVADTVPWQ